MLKTVREEIFYPLFIEPGNGAASIIVRAIRSESGDQQQLLLAFPGMAENPLEHPALDPIGLKILGGLSKTCESRRNGDGDWEINLQF